MQISLLEYTVLLATLGDSFKIADSQFRIFTYDRILREDAWKVLHDRMNDPEKDTIEVSNSSTIP